MVRWFIFNTLTIQKFYQSRLTFFGFILKLYSRKLFKFKCIFFSSL